MRNTGSRGSVFFVYGERGANEQEEQRVPLLRRNGGVREWSYEKAGYDSKPSQKKGSIIFSVWPGTQTPAFSDLKIA